MPAARLVFQDVEILGHRPLICSGSTEDHLLDPWSLAQRLEHRANRGTKPNQVLRPSLADQQIPERPFENQTAATKNADCVTYLLDVGQDVTREHNGGIATEPCDQVQHLAPSQRIERRAGLVEQDQLGTRHQGRGHTETLQHATGEAADRTIRRIGDACFERASP